MPVAQLLKTHHHLLTPEQGPVLDLACGEGQNGLFLMAQNIEVCFADINADRLDQLNQQFDVSKNQCWQADFESASSKDADLLATKQFQAVMVFRYLHRPLFEAIKKAVRPGGFVIYETFTTENRAFGRPHRADFLLVKDELKKVFEDWEIVFYFEGIQQNPDRAIAQIVCKKP